MLARWWGGEGEAICVSGPASIGDLLLNLPLGVEQKIGTSVRAREKVERHCRPSASTDPADAGERNEAHEFEEARHRKGNLQDPDAGSVG